MEEWIQAQLAAGLPAFAGTAISGTVAVKQELLNEVLARWIAEQGGRTSARAGAIDMTQAMRHLKHAAVRAEGGTLSVDFKVEV
jgi:hypothetical protein